ncbi:MAG: DUF4150 domain-containing protein [Geminicoccaceae bacterium]
MTITFANDKTIVHKGDGLQFVAMAPDVCKTPSPGGPVPIPYPNLAFSSDLAEGTKSIKVEGNPAAKADSNLRMSTGDEGGTAGGGIMSNKIKGKMTWVLYSSDVKFEGKGVVRFFDSDLHNGNASNVMGTTGGTLYPHHDNPLDIKCDNCGKSIHDECHKKIQSRSSNKSDNAAMDVRAPAGKMKSAIITDSGPFTNFAGNTSAALTTDNFAGKVRNLNTGKLVPASGPHDTNTAGNCAEQKALFDAAQAGAVPPSGPAINISTVQFERKEKGKNVYSRQKACRTCQRVLTSMLCEEPASPPPESPPAPQRGAKRR